MNHEDDVLENVLINGPDKNTENTEPIDETSPILPKYNYPEWYNEIQHGFYRKTICRLQKLFKMNVEAAKYYEKINFYIFGPSITITALSSMASFLSTTDLLGDSAKTGFGISVGVLTVISTAMQSVAGTCQYKSRSEAFRLSADRYEQLLTKLRFESEMPKKEDFLEKLEAEILEVQGKNTYFPPEKISSKYNVNESYCDEL
jgi:hypothetical protein